mmetsp:Transcript_7569/g.10859  ORF Transcript_7569/g.10859 Transcript_7569/m.10859 type:complete len:95 (+) Transcript_7569:455-739(+)
MRRNRISLLVFTLNPTFIQIIITALFHDVLKAASNAVTGRSIAGILVISVPFSHLNGFILYHERMLKCMYYAMPTLISVYKLQSILLLLFGSSA